VRRRCERVELLAKNAIASLTHSASACMLPAVLERVAETTREKLSTRARALAKTRQVLLPFEVPTATPIEDKEGEKVSVVGDSSETFLPNIGTGAVPILGRPSPPSLVPMSTEVSVTLRPARMASKAAEAEAEAEAAEATRFTLGDAFWVDEEVPFKELPKGLRALMGSEDDSNHSWTHAAGSPDSSPKGLRRPSRDEDSKVFEDPKGSPKGLRGRPKGGKKGKGKKDDEEDVRGTVPYSEARAAYSAYLCHATEEALDAIAQTLERENGGAPATELAFILAPQLMESVEKSQVH